MSYPFFKKGLKRCCYWCSQDDKRQLSDDHLPPKSIFPKEEREGLQLITAPICDKCKARRKRSGEDDEVFIRHMQLWASLRSGGKDTKKRLEHCIERHRSPKPSGIVPAEYLKVHLSTGGTVHYPILKGGKEVIVGVLNSVARGFYYRMSGEIIPEHIPPELRFRPRGSFTPPKNLLPVMTPCVVKKHVFEFSPVLYEEKRFNFLCWEFKFYNLDPLPIYYSYYLNRQ